MVMMGTMAANAWVRDIGTRGGASFTPGVLTATLRRGKIRCGRLWDMRRYDNLFIFLSFGVNKGFSITYLNSGNMTRKMNQSSSWNT